MKPPIRASYGDKDHGHALLKSDCDPEQLPTELLGLTDRPSGNSVPGEQWWPSIGCGPVGSWWAIWWTIPDTNSTRAGMVHSEVALFPLDEIGAVNDLRPIISELSSNVVIPEPSPKLLNALIESLLSKNVKPPVIYDIESLPGLIINIWPQLWADARCSFATRVALSPPQSGNSISPPWFFAIPSGRELQWVESQIVSSELCPEKLSRATSWLLGEADLVMDEILEACDTPPKEFFDLSRIARAADRLELFRKSPKPEYAIDLLRTLITVAPEAQPAVDLKQEALELLKNGFLESDSKVVFSLSNIKSEYIPVGWLPTEALNNWVDHNAPEMPLEEAADLLQRLSPDQSQKWWQQAILFTLNKRMTLLDQRWSSAAIQWMGLSYASVFLDKCLSTTDGNEQLLLVSACDLKLTEGVLTNILKESKKRQWSCLHACAVMKSFSEQEAITEQMKFSKDPYPGLGFLVSNISGSVIVESAISTSDKHFIELVSHRTVQEPELLKKMDASSSDWRILWVSHIENGGKYWPPNATKKVLTNDLLDSALSDHVTEGLIAVLAKDIASIATLHPRRKELWSKLRNTDRSSLLLCVAEKLIKDSDSGMPVPVPERELAEAVVKKVSMSLPSANLIKAMFTWNVHLNEQEVLKWLSALKVDDWRSLSDVIGHAAQDNNWKKVAKELYSRYESIPELRPAVEVCSQLLPIWDLAMLSIKGFKQGSVTENDKALATRLAELGATLAPEQLSDVWERAGGHRKNLNLRGTPDVLWREAATMAQQGKLKGGLQPLLQELLSDHPHNSDLLELQSLIQGV